MATKAGKLGQIHNTSPPAVREAIPSSMPALRPRVSLTEARNGPNTPVAERSESAIASSSSSTPSPRPNTGSKG